MLSIDSIHARYSSIRSNLPKGVRIIAVTKGRGAQDIYALTDAGAREIGESRVQEAKEKFPELRISNKIIRHLIGHLQRNKVRDAVRLFDVIQSVDSLPLAEKIAKEAMAQKKKIAVYVQFNVSQKSGRFGFGSERELTEAVEKIRLLQTDFFKLEGLMGIATPEHPQKDFETLKRLADALHLPVRSWGMSDDYEEAVFFGANTVRIGRAIFGG